jgi:magnesium chelatase subunit I
MLFKELVLYGLSEYSQLSRHNLARGIEFKDLMSGMFSMKRDARDLEE